LRLRKLFPDKERSFTIPFGKTIPVVTAILFGGLMTGIFVDCTRDYLGNILFHNYWVALAMAAFAVVCILYTLLFVPQLKILAAQRASSRKRRRPGKN
jgi:riboflavin transporter FmnP